MKDFPFYSSSLPFPHPNPCITQNMTLSPTNLHLLPTTILAPLNQRAVMEIIEKCISSPP